MGKLRVYCLKTLNKLSIYPLGNTPSAPSVTLAIHLRALIEGSHSPSLLFVEALHTHRGSLAYSSRTPPSLCLDIVPYHSRCLATTPSVRYPPFYSSLLLLLWSPILPKPQARLTTPHHSLDLAYTLFPPRVPITRFVSLAYSPFFPSPPTTPFSIWTLPAHCYISPVHFLLLRYASRKYVPLLRATPFSL